MVGSIVAVVARMAVVGKVVVLVGMVVGWGLVHKEVGKVVGIVGRVVVVVVAVLALCRNWTTTMSVWSLVALERAVSSVV